MRLGLGSKKHICVKDWPLLSTHEVARSSLLIKALLSLGLEGATAVPLDLASWQAAWPELHSERMAGLALGALKASEADLGESISRKLLMAATADTANALHVETTAAPVLEALSLRHPPLVFKGPASASLYEELSWRPFRDIDILIEPTELGFVKDILGRHGFGPPMSGMLPWDSFGRLCIEGHNWTADGSVSIDIHHHVPPWKLGAQLSAAGVRGRASLGKVAGVPVLFPSDADSLVIVALHVVNDCYKGTPSLVSWGDLARLGHRFSQEERRDIFARKGLAVLGCAVERSLATLSQDPKWPFRAVGWPGRRSEALRLKALGWGNSGSLARHPSGWAARLPIPNAGLFLAGSLVPSPKYIRMRQGSYLRYWGQCMQTVSAVLSGQDLRRSDLGHETWRNHREEKKGAVVS